MVLSSTTSRFFFGEGLVDDALRGGVQPWVGDRIKPMTKLDVSQGGSPAREVRDERPSRDRSLARRSHQADLVGLKMPRAIEILDVTVRRLEHGEMTAIEVIDALLAEELTLRENHRIKIALMMARLSTIKTLAGFDFSFQHSLDKNRIMALAELEFINRSEVVHFLGPTGTGKSHLSLALGVQAVKAGRSVYFTPLSDLVSALAKAEREGTLREKIRFFCRFSLLIVDEIGYLPVVAGGGNLFFQLVNARYEKGAMIRPAATPCHCHPDRGFELSAPSARRSCTRPHPLKCPSSIVDRADQASRSTAETRSC
jgi:DNA replication protein DnaC